MTNDADKDDPQASETGSTALDSFLEHVQAAMQCVGNLRWDEVKFHLDSMDAIAAAATPKERVYINAFHEPTRGFALGFQLFAIGKTAEDKEKALEYLSQARDALRKVKAEQRKLTENPGFVQFARAIETQILNVQVEIARKRGEMEKTALLVQQRDQLMNETLEGLDPDDPMRNFLEGLKLFQEVQPNFLKGLQCLVVMNLDRAQDYLEESAKSVSAMRDLFSKAKADDSLILLAGKHMAEGFGLLVSGQEAYVRTLRTAILGDVNRSDVEALANAEKAFLNGADLILKSAQALPGVLGELNLGPVAATQAELTRNLRTLCERSLSPKTITATTAPKVVFYFIGTFLVLLIGLPTSGLVARLQTSDLGLVLIVSLFVSVIGAFGFEATRLVPLFEVFSRLTPWGRSAEPKPKEP